MSERRLTEAELDSLDQWGAFDLHDAGCERVAAVVAELRDLRGLLAEIERITDDEEDAPLAMRDIRAALAAKGGAK